VWGYFSAAIQSESRFGAYSITQVGNNAIKLVLLTGIIAAGWLTATSLMAATVAGFAAAAAVGHVLAPAFARRPKWHRSAGPAVIRYSRWLVISSLMFLLYSRMDILLLSRLTDSETVGVYSAAATMAQAADLMAASVMTVLLPRFSRHTASGALRGQVGMSLKCSAAVVVPMIPCYWLLEPVMGVVFGASYAASAGFLKIMYFGLLATMVTHPLHLLFFARGKPQVLTALDVVLLVFNAAGHTWAITHYGALGAAWVVLASRCLGAALLSGAIGYELGGRRGRGDG
ncbi:MAG: oligosaccharide flippase family protein, partial [Phycisphaerales bacterium]|nr:oligosaccharide flippase family protein [Phycisphaerales bacterium]